MIIKKTDSLGVEILSVISKYETGGPIKPVKTKDDAINKKNEDSLILFEVYEDGKVEGYFTIEIKVYEK